jgi:parallel beta-helix repeat protein
MKSLSQIEPRTLIATLPATLAAPGSYCLVTNLTGAAGSHGIIIAADNITLDLNGFTLLGATESLNGIHLQGPRHNITIQNGTVANWETAVEGNEGSQSRIHQLQTIRNRQSGIVAGAASILRQCLVASNGAFGLSIGEEGLVEDCVATANGLHGIVTRAAASVSNCNSTKNRGDGFFLTADSSMTGGRALRNGGSGITAASDVQIHFSSAAENQGKGIAAGPSAQIHNSSFSRNLDAGIIAGPDSQIIGCKANANAKGIQVDVRSTIRNCTAKSNGGDGIIVTSECVVVGNGCSNNFSARDSAGIHATGTDNSIQENHVSSNDRGIAVDAPGNLVIRNSASNNTLNYFVIGEQTIGPIFTERAVEQATNPWTNFQF